METKRLSKVIDGHMVLDRLDLTIAAGSIHGIIGANGAGKTTLLRLLNGVYRPTLGEVSTFGQPLPYESASIRQRIHLVNADGAYYPGFRVQDLLRYASMVYDRWDQARCDALIRALQLPLSQSIRKLSLGAKMQLRLAVALSSLPDVLLLDEPTNGLDPVVRRQFLQLIVQEVAENGTTVVMATHRVEDLEAMADHVSVLYQGRLILSGSMESFKRDFHEVIAVSEDDVLPATIKDCAQIKSVHSRGKVHAMVVQGDPNVVCAALHRCGAKHVEVQSVQFEDLFRALMEKEGYTRDAILLS